LNTVETIGGGGAVMVKVTEMVALGTPDAEMVAAPVYVFGVRVDTSVEFRATVRVWGVLAEAGVTVKKLPLADVMLIV